MLADQLSRKGRGEEAIEQLQLLYVRYAHEGRDAEARATVERMRAIDPSAEPRALGDAPSRSAADLVFLDLNDGAQERGGTDVFRRHSGGLQFIDTSVEPTRVSPMNAETPRISTPAVPAAPLVEILETTVLEPAVLDGVARTDEFEHSAGAESSGSLLEGLEATSIADDASSRSSAELLDFEPTSFEASVPEVTSLHTPRALDALLDFELPRVPSSYTPPSSLQALESLELASDDDEARRDADADDEPFDAHTPLSGLPMLLDEDDDELGESQSSTDDSIGGALDLIMPEATPEYGVPVQDSALDELPLMDLDLPHSGEADVGVASVELGRADALDLAERDSFGIQTPAPAPRQSTVLAEQSVELLQALADADPDDNALRRRLAEAMLESGDREGGLRELERAMVGFERLDNLMAASKLADEIVLLNPESVRHHQKRVEYAFRTNERGRLIEAYLQLADALFRAGQVDKSRAIYQRVIDLSPDDAEAHAALASFPEPEPEPAPESPRGRHTTPVTRMSAAPVAPVLSRKPDDEYINLGDWLRDDEAPKDTRMVVDEQEPTGDEEADFQDMLQKFKQGISENVEEEDHQSHYDLGVAFKEMGLLDEAISQFQKALRSPANRVSTYEALGVCFIEKAQYPMAATILSRAMHEPGMRDDQLVGILYLAGLCAEQRGQRDLAIELYQRVFVVDIQFRDVAERLAAVEGAS
jgi:tetratricopeptide (TPR) repeat protein